MKKDTTTPTRGLRGSVYDALHAVLNYLNEERNDYMASGESEHHIWRDVVLLKLWLSDSARLFSLDDVPMVPGLSVTAVEPRAAGGVWVTGTLHGYRFCALVFLEHARNASWELGKSYISKLWVQTLLNLEVVYEWERGLTCPAKDAAAQSAVDVLAAELHKLTFARQLKRP